MDPQTSGNGATGNSSTRIEIDFIPQAADWILIYPKNPPPWPVDLPIAIGEVLRRW